MRLSRELTDEVVEEEEEEEDKPKFSYDPDEEDRRRVTFECAGAIARAGLCVRGNVLDEEDKIYVLANLGERDRVVFATWMAVNNIRSTSGLLPEGSQQEVGSTKDKATQIVRAVLGANEYMEDGTLYEGDYKNIVEGLRRADLVVFTTWLKMNNIVVKKGKTRVQRAARRLKIVPQGQSYEDALYKSAYIRKARQLLSPLSMEEKLKLKGLNNLLDHLIDEDILE